MKLIVDLIYEGGANREHELLDLEQRPNTVEYVSGKRVLPYDETKSAAMKGILTDTQSGAVRDFMTKESPRPPFFKSTRRNKRRSPDRGKSERSSGA